MKIKKPKKINQFATACLEALKESESGMTITLGGAFGLSHYHEYRSTKDIDAWWVEDVRETEKQKVVELLKNILLQFGDVNVRRFGDVVSIDLIDKKKVLFNFQIAQRDTLLNSPITSPWPPVTLDSFEDLLASKMKALIDRGIPRDFIDIFELCDKQLANISFCWRLWKEREIKRGISDPDMRTACEALRLHLNRIEKMRPLDSIQDSHQKTQANRLRTWFKNEFCKK